MISSTPTIDPGPIQDPGKCGPRVYRCTGNETWETKYPAGTPLSCLVMKNHNTALDSGGTVYSADLTILLADGVPQNTGEYAPQFKVLTSVHYDATNFMPGTFA